MTSDLDVYRTANVLISQHGHDAAAFAAKRRDELSAAGDLDGCAVWNRIIDAILVLQANEAPGAAPIQ